VKEVVTLVSAGTKVVLITALPSPPPTLMGGVNIPVHKNLQHMVPQYLPGHRKKTRRVAAITMTVIVCMCYNSLAMLVCVTTLTIFDCRNSIRQIAAANFIVVSPTTAIFSFQNYVQV